ncbi:MAG: hypothetical protein LBC73_00800, partial [Oscillospiraceae bacterium]|nr:hypothetical protein [Oscillospiraceae bacterium]
MKYILAITLMFISLFLNACGGEADTDTDIEIIDLTVLRANLRTAQIANIYQNPSQYVDKIIRVQGVFTYAISQNGDLFTYVLTIDGDDCCQEGFEFRLSGDPIFPDDFPKDRATIIIEGTIKNYQEGR